MRYVVRVGFDETLRRYFVIESDIPGLNVETDDFESLVEVVRDVAPEMHGTACADDSIVFERQIALV